MGCSRERTFINESFPSISWNIDSLNSDVLMDAYEMELCLKPDETSAYFKTGEVLRNNSVNVAWPTEGLHSRQIVFLRIRSRCNREWGSWSEFFQIETSLLLNEDWQGEFITFTDDEGKRRMSASPILRREFSIQKKVDKARLYATALGVCEIRINDKKVSENFFEPGWTDYRYELPVVTYDVTHLLNVGENTLSAIIGDGWFRGQIGWEAHRKIYGEEIALNLQLEYECGSEKYRLYTDGSWQASVGEIAFADIYEGCHIDFSQLQSGWRISGFDATKWENAKVLDFPNCELRPTETPAIRETSFLNAEIRYRRNEFKTIFELPRNITGWVALKVRGKEGTRVTIRHSEVLDQQGELYLKNLRMAKATDSYVLGQDGIFTLEPLFTYHGFQFFEVEGDVEVLEAGARVVHTDINESTFFECSNEKLNALLRNIKNSQCSNFFSVPTDCPQRDERLGWTGDIQTFSKTAVLLYDCEYFLKSWLRQLAYSQRANGTVTSVVPDVLEIYEEAGHESTGVTGWGDAVTIVPWNVYQAYGNQDNLKLNLPAMIKWVNYLESITGSSGLIENMEGQLGDWLDPDAPHGYPGKGKTDALLIANSFYIWSTRLIGKTFQALGDHQNASKYFDKAKFLANQCLAKWRDEMLSTSTGCALAIEFEIVSENERNLFGKALSNLIFKNAGKASFGLVGTGRVLPALSRTGYWDAAFTALFNEECPGWMYQVLSGATSMWERWDGRLPDGSIDEEPHFWKGRDVGMNSFNHYHLGSIGDWVLEHIGGIGIIEGFTAFEKVSIAPRSSEHVTWSKTRISTVRGSIQVNWAASTSGISGTLTIPPTVVGILKNTMDIPDSIFIGKKNVGKNEVELGSGTYEFRMTGTKRRGT